MRRNYRVFVKIDNRGFVIPGSIVKRFRIPKAGHWIPLDENQCCAVPLAPAAPTGGVVDDTANTFAWTPNPLFPLATDYEQSLDSGATWAASTVNPIAGLTGNRAIGSVQVRVKSVGGKPTSASISNTVAYTT